MENSETNIVLIGMPGCGKSSIGHLLAQQMKRDFLDTDQLIEQKTQLPVAEIFAKHGEVFFRAQEAEIAGICSQLKGKVIATGGGMVLNAENIRQLKQTGRIYYLQRELQLLARKGRPLSSSANALEKLFEQRAALYLLAADCVVDNQGPLQQVVQAILDDFTEVFLNNEKTRKGTKKILVINGPNINMLGIREPQIYGQQTYAQLLDFIRQCAAELQLDVDCYQSNHEGALVDTIQGALGKYDGIVINPAAYTHTSIAILDALKAVHIPAVEVHLSAVQQREEFRQISYAGMACCKTIAGLGFQGYREAMVFLKSGASVPLVMIDDAQNSK